MDTQGQRVIQVSSFTRLRGPEQMVNSPDPHVSPVQKTGRTTAFHGSVVRVDVEKQPSAWCIVGAQENLSFFPFCLDNQELGKEDPELRPSWVGGAGGDWLPRHQWRLRLSLQLLITATGRRHRALVTSLVLKDHHLESLPHLLK